MIRPMHWLAVSELSIPAGDAWLSDAERGRQATMRFTKRRTEYRLRRYAGKRAVSALLSRDLGLADLAGVELLNRPGGAPYVRLDGRDADFDVSLTDRAGWAIALAGPAGSMAGTLGVDLEIVEERSRGFVSDYFTAAEQEWIRGAGEPGSEAYAVAANLIWSAKEAALKVLQVGLRADTRTVEVHLSRCTRAADGWGRHDRGRTAWRLNAGLVAARRRLPADHCIPDATASPPHLLGGATTSRTACRGTRGWPADCCARVTPRAQ
jgi:4'-phosphopantetheinyl transferase